MHFIHFIAIIFVFFVGNILQYFCNHQAKYFGEGVELRFVYHSFTHLIADFALHAIDVDSEIYQRFIFDLLHLKGYLDGSNNGGPTFIAALTVQS